MNDIRKILDSNLIPAARDKIVVGCIVAILSRITGVIRLFRPGR